MDYQIIKTNQESDFESIKNVYYKTWLYSYVGLVPQGFLDNLDRNIWHPEKRWNNTLIAISDHQTVGVVSFGPARRQKYSGFGEIYSLYILPQYQHQGIGQKLFQTALDILEKEFQQVYLIVLKDNLIAQAFYEMFGFEETLDQIAEQTEYGMIHEVIFIKN
jgi:Acetyltransferases